MTFDLVSYIKRQQEWSRETFGPGRRTGGILEHIAKELEEVRAAPDDLDEWVDIIILALDGAWRCGNGAYMIASALRHKQEKNKQRSWPDWREGSEDHAIEHKP